MQTKDVNLKSIRKNYRCSIHHVEHLKRIKKLLKKSKSELETTDTAIIEESVRRFFYSLKNSEQSIIGLS